MQNTKKYDQKSAKTLLEAPQEWMLCALLYLSKDCILRGVSVFKYSFILLKFSLFYVQYVDIFARIAKKCVHLQKDLMLIRKTY